MLVTALLQPQQRAPNVAKIPALAGLQYYSVSRPAVSKKRGVAFLQLMKEVGRDPRNPERKASDFDGALSIAKR